MLVHNFFLDAQSVCVDGQLEEEVAGANWRLYYTVTPRGSVIAQRYESDIGRRLGKDGQLHPSWVTDMPSLMVQDIVVEQLQLMLKREAQLAALVDDEETERAESIGYRSAA